MSIRRRVVKVNYVDVQIPPGHVVCPKCKGTGRYRFRWSEPSFFNVPGVSDYHQCMRCMGEGYIPISDLKEGEK